MKKPTEDFSRAGSENGGVRYLRQDLQMTKISSNTKQLAVAARATESTVTITEAIPSFSSDAAKAKPIAVIQSMNSFL